MYINLSGQAFTEHKVTASIKFWSPTFWVPSFPFFFRVCMYVCYNFLSELQPKWNKYQFVFFGLSLFVNAVARGGCLVHQDVDRWRCSKVLELIFLPTECILYGPRKTSRCLTGFCLKNQSLRSSVTICVGSVTLSVWDMKYFNVLLLVLLQS
jgi:hypothetical protein